MNIPPENKKIIGDFFNDYKDKPQNNKEQLSDIIKTDNNLSPSSYQPTEIDKIKEELNYNRQQFDRLENMILKGFKQLSENNNNSENKKHNNLLEEYGVPEISIENIEFFNDADILNITNMSFKCNDSFINIAKSLGFKGDTDEQVTEEWFSFICRSMFSEEM